MQFTISILLTAAFATVSTAAFAAPKPLPAKFTLTMSPKASDTGTVVDYFPPVVTIDDGSASSPMSLGGLNHPGLPQIFLIGYRSGNNGAVIHGPAGNYAMFIAPWGEVHFETEPVGVSSGFVDAGGVLALDVGDGKGAMERWSACARGTRTDNWSVWWDVEGKSGCVPISLKVVAL